MAEQLVSIPKNNNQSKTELEILSDYLKNKEVVCSFTKNDINKWVEDDATRNGLYKLMGKTLTLLTLNLCVLKLLENDPYRSSAYIILIGTFLDNEDLNKIENYNLAIAQQNKNKS